MSKSRRASREKEFKHLCCYNSFGCVEIGDRSNDNERGVLTTTEPPTSCVSTHESMSKGSLASVPCRKTPRINHCDSDTNHCVTPPAPPPDHYVN